jgi:RHS repeat-associated protein
VTAKLCSDISWKAGLRSVGDPVDVVTGAQTSVVTDFQLRGAHVPLSGVRYYDSGRHQIDRGIGHGFWFSFDIELRFDLDGLTFVGSQGDSIEFPFLSDDGDRVMRGAHELERVSPTVYRIHPPGGEPSLEFLFDRDVVSRPGSMFYEDDLRPPLRLQYDKGRLSAIQVDPIRRVSFEYVGKHLTSVVLLESGTTNKQRLVRYGYDSQGRLIEVENAYGGILRYEYDANNRVSRTVDRRGYSFFFEYDNDGRCNHTWAEDGVEDYRLEFKLPEHLTVVTRGDGGVTSYYYDDQKELIQVIDPCGGVTAYLKDEDGRVVTEVDPNGNKSEILYDERGLAYAKRDPQGHLRRLPEDPSPHPLSHELPETPVEWEHGEWPGPIALLPDGIPLKYWLPRWLVQLWGSNPTVALPEPRPITDMQGLLLREERKDGKSRRWAYDQNGFDRWYTDLDGRTTRYENGSWNFLLREIDPLGSITEYAYTKSEEVAAIVDPLGTRSEYSYDLKDRLVEVRRHGKVRERYLYDAADNLVEKRDDQGRLLLKLAVGKGDLIEQRMLGSGDTEDFAYCNDGRLAKAKNQAGVVTFSYDGSGRRTADERDGKGVRHRFVSDRLVETTVLGKFVIRYNQVDETTSVVLDPGGQTQRLRLRAPGLIQRSCSNDVEEMSHYDPSGRCLLKAAEGAPGLANGTGGWARRFVYSGEGDLLRRDDNVRGTTTFEHDDAHRLSKVHSADGTVEEYVYDRAGNLLRAPGLSARMQTGNRLLEANDDQFSYDERDNVAQRKGRAGTITYTYDSRDLLKVVDAPDVVYQAVHDGLGRRTLKMVNGQVWRYYWDTDRLAAEIFPDGRLRVYVYPDATALVPILFLEYDSVDASPESGKRYHVHTDHLGCPELVLDDAGQTVWHARIDPYGTAHVEVGQTFHQPLRWPGHYYDAETGLHDNRFRTYSPEIGRYLQSDPAGIEGGINLYAYTDNPLRTVDLNGLEPCKAAKAAAEAAKNDEKGKNSEGTTKGAQRGPKTDPKAPHNAKIRAEADKLEDQGNTILAGGGREKEKLIPTPGGKKEGRRPDILYRTPEGEVRGRNVGKADASGRPVTRERAALADLNGPGGLPTDFVPYNK